jgi:FkbM family methyltransferase
MILNPSIEYERNLLFVAQYHERAERRFIRRVLRPGDYVIDVGANIGVFTLFFRRIVGACGKVTAIEPEPTNYRKLVVNCAINDGGIGVITTHNVGVAAEPRTFTLHLDPSNPGAHSILPVDGSVKAIEIRCVPLATLIDWERRPRLLKIDIEGFEYPVLEGYFADMPRELRPDFIMLEDWPNRRAADSTGLCLANGYRQLERHNANVMLQRA